MRALRPTRLLSLAFAVLLFEASAGFGFQDQGLANPTIKSTTQLIQFIVIASGKRDSPAPNLVRENFRVRENGKEHPVAFFKKYDAVDQGTNPAAPARLGAFSNVLDTPQTDNRNILLLDRADTDPISWQRGRTPNLRISPRLEANGSYRDLSVDIARSSDRAGLHGRFGFVAKAATEFKSNHDV